MKKKNELPVIKKKKKIDLKKFKVLAEEVRKIFEEEAEHFEQRKKENENYSSTRFLSKA